MSKVDQIMAITTNSNDYMQALYLDYVNNFITVEGFAEYYDLTEREAFTLISIGKRIHEKRVIHLQG